MNGLYKIKRTLERRNHTTKMKVDARDYHTRLLLALRLRCCCCYARKNRDMGYAIEMATEIRPGYRYEAPSMVGRVPAAREKSRPIVLLGLCTQANYNTRYLLTRMQRLTNLCTLSANSSGMCSLPSCPSPLASLVAFEYVVGACGAATYR